MITSVKLENFKCFQKVSINLSNLNLLMGLNGAGKSSLIQALLLLAQTPTDKEDKIDGIMLSGDLLELGTGKNILNEYANVEEIVIHITTNIGQSKFSFDYAKDKDFLPLNRFEGDTKTITDYLKNLHYISANRIGPSAIHDVSYYASRRGTSVGPAGNYAISFLAQNSDRTVMKPMHHINATTHQLIDQTNAWMGEISPGVSIHPKMLEEANKAVATFSFESRRSRSKGYSPVNVGHGISYVLPIVVAILSAEPKNIIIIENPEAHIHPKGQAALGQLLALAASSGVQLIVETHSDHVMNAIRVAVKNKFLESDAINILYFEQIPEDDKFDVDIQRLELDENGRIDFWPKGFLDQWDISLRELLV